jgi:hypothetical protein
LNDRPENKPPPPLRLRLPGFVADREIGLGDVVGKATSVLGVPPCSACRRRAAALNRMVRFLPRRP